MPQSESSTSSSARKAQPSLPEQEQQEKFAKKDIMEEEQNISDYSQLSTEASIPLKGTISLTQKACSPTFLFRAKRFFIVLLLLSQLSIWYFSSKPEEPTTPTYFPDLTTIKGNSKEAYAFFFCTRQTASPDLQMMYEGLKVIIYRLKQLHGAQKDIIVGACQFISHEQMDAIRKLDVIVVPIQTINPPIRYYNYEKWIDTFTKLAFWRLTNWERILFMDIDIFFTDSFIDLWNDPATKVVESPPEGVDAESTYFGIPVKNLYPYLFAATYDTWHTQESIEQKTMNSGVFMYKPSLIHYDMLIDIAYNDPSDFGVMEQTELTYVYNRLGGPIPWVPFDLHYNYAVTEEDNHISDLVKGYHLKAWDKNPTERWEPLSKQWHAYHDEMNSIYKDVTIVTDSRQSRVFNNALTVSGLKLSSGTGRYYAIASTDLKNLPNAHQIKEGLDAFGSACPSANSATNGFTLEGLEPDTNYMIYYFADVDNGFPKFTDVKHVQLRTSSKINEI